MKKFNPEKELNIVKSKNKSYTASKFNSAFIPLLVVGCSVLALIGVTFSYKLLAEDSVSYTVKIDIINGNEGQYIKKVPAGAFKDKISSSSAFGSLTCIEGNLSYDPITETVFTPYIKQDTSCILAFRDDSIKKISLDDLDSVADNFGTSYYYKANAKNNYILINGFMFRIVRVNGDGSLRVISNDNILSSTYSSFDFESSNALITLRTWFNENFSNKEYVVDGDYDITNYVEVEISNLVSLDGYFISKVGLLSVREAELITSDVEGSNFIDTTDGMFLANPNGTNSIYAYAKGTIVSSHPDASLNLRPVINVKGTVVGEGTIGNPFRLEED